MQEVSGNPSLKRE